MTTLSAELTFAAEFVGDFWHRTDRSQKPHDETSMSLADVHAALAYYYDHQEDIDRDIMQSAQLVADMEAQQRVHDQQRLSTDADPIPSR